MSRRHVSNKNQRSTKINGTQLANHILSSIAKYETSAASKERICFLMQSFSCKFVKKLTFDVLFRNILFERDLIVNNCAVYGIVSFYFFITYFAQSSLFGGFFQFLRFHRRPKHGRKGSCLENHRLVRFQSSVRNFIFAAFTAKIFLDKSANPKKCIQKITPKNSVSLFQSISDSKRQLLINYLFGHSRQGKRYRNVHFTVKSIQNA